MPSRYQTIFTVIADDTAGHELLENVRDFLRNSIAEQFGNPSVATDDEGLWEKDDGQLRVDSDRRDEFAFYSLNWKRSDEWELRWRLATKGDNVEIEVQVSGPDNDPPTAGPPSLLKSLIDRYTCRIHGEDLQSEPIEITDENVAWYADSLAFAPERRIPVVAVSEGITGEAGQSTKRAINALRGIATVVSYSKENAASVNSRLGRLGCSGGEVRVYRPDAARADAPELHRRWRPANVDWTEIRDECMHLLPLSDGPRLYHEVRDEIFRRWDAELAEVEKDVAEDDEVHKERLATLVKELADTKGAVASLETDRDHWKAQSAKNARELAAATDKLAAVSAREESLRGEIDSRDSTIAELLTDLNKKNLSDDTIRQLQNNLSAAQDESKKNAIRADASQKELEDKQKEADNLRGENESLIQQLLSKESSIAALTKERDDATRDAADLREELRDAESRSGMKKHSRRQAKHVYKEEVERLQEKIDSRDFTISQKDRRIEDLERMINETNSVQPSGGINGTLEEPPPSEDEELVAEDSGGAAPETPSQPASVNAVLLEAQRLPNLRLLDSAFESSLRSPFERLGALREALEAISECGELRSRSGSVGKNLEAWFRQKGVTYKPHESEQTNIRHPRLFYDNHCERELNMEEHIAFGGGGTRDERHVLRIHMAWCEKEKVWVIGHVGRHLDIATS